MLSGPEMGIPFFGAAAGFLLSVIGTGIVGDEDIANGPEKNQYGVTVAVQATLLIALAHMLQGGVGCFVAYAAAFFFTTESAPVFLSAAVFNDDGLTALEDKYTAGYAIVLAGLIVAWASQLNPAKLGNIGEALSGGLFSLLGLAATVGMFVASFIVFSVYDKDDNTTFGDLGVGTSLLIAAFLLLTIFLFGVKDAVWILIFGLSTAQEDLFSTTLDSNADDTRKTGHTIAFISLWVALVAGIMRLEGEMGGLTDGIISKALAAVGLVVAIIGASIGGKALAGNGDDDQDNWTLTNISWIPAFILIGLLFTGHRRQGFILLATAFFFDKIIDLFLAAWIEDKGANKDDDVYNGAILAIVGYLVAYLGCLPLVMDKLAGVVPAGLNKLIVVAGSAALLVGCFILWGVADKDANFNGAGIFAFALATVGFFVAIYYLFGVNALTEASILIAGGHLAAEGMSNFFQGYDSLAGQPLAEDEDAGKIGYILGFLGLVLVFFGTAFHGQEKEGLGESTSDK